MSDPSRHGVVRRVGVPPLRWALASYNRCTRSVETLPDVLKACQVLIEQYTAPTMYTIKEAALRTGLTEPVLRAWERRYGVVTPARTAGGYRVYDETALRRLRSMRRLIADGWSASSAAAAIVAGTEPAT